MYKIVKISNRNGYRVRNVLRLGAKCGKNKPPKRVMTTAVHGRGGQLSKSLTQPSMPKVINVGERKTM